MSASAPPLVIVVGSGLAGLSASYEALQRGANVKLLDSAPKPGGNSIKASSGINGAGSRFQKALGIDKDESFYEDTVRSAGVRFKKSGEPAVARAGLVAKLVNESAGAVEWLADEIGVDLSVVAALGGHSVARTHRGGGKLPPGAAIVSALLAKLKANGNFHLRNSARVTSLITGDAGVVQGVQYESDSETHSLTGKVVFASGGFAGDATGLLARYRPDLQGMPSTNEERPGSHDILFSVGAQLLDMDSVQIHPTGFVDPANANAKLKFLAAEMLRGHGGILLSAESSRFVDELETRANVSKAIMNLPGAEVDGVKQWNITLLLDSGAAKAAASHIGFYEWKGLLKKVAVKDLSPEIIAAVDKYAAAVESSAQDEFGRRTYGEWELKPGEANRDEFVYVGRVTPIVHFTMGGVAIDDKAQVLRKGEDGKLVPVPGLYAAGEITGGVHGDNRLGGSSLLECVVFGRAAGVEAAHAAFE
ncbi:Flavocytochrome c [Beauveria brongniartii RCEF 3172]|uniref:Fumarate reductase n=1 Tax=Beauveria brongniartii RCEF 3172 TaxID=1081107 RepID=A0A167HUS5_9HYPO|nr:Flavocytochrome c [Beauveria brongniartii RCEF 3172]